MAASGDERSGGFQQDRLLGSTLEGEGGIRVIVRALSSDPKLWTAYKKSLELNERLTNPIAGDGARSLHDLSQGNFDGLPQRRLDDDDLHARAAPGWRRREKPAGLFVKIAAERPCTTVGGPYLCPG